MMRLVRNASRRLAPGPSSKEVMLRKNRMRISKYIARIGRKAELELSLDSYGICYIPFKKFLIVIEVPEDRMQDVFFDTKVFDIGSARNPAKICRRIALARSQNVRFGKEGAELHVEDGEAILSLSRKIQDLSFRDMVDCIEDFMQTAIDINRDLATVI